MTNSIVIDKLSMSYPLIGSEARSLKKTALSQFNVGGSFSVNGDSVKALTGISLSIGPGEYVCLTGHNGSGKSTLLRVISGIFSPSEGSIFSSGKIVSIFDPGASVDRELTGRENTHIFLLNYMSVPKARDFDSIREFSELGDYYDLPVKTYSNGMFARLVYSLICCLEFDILILDEEIGMADGSFLSKIHKEITTKMSADGILLFASHDLNIQRSFLNRRILMENGSIVKDEKL